MSVLEKNIRYPGVSVVICIIALLLGVVAMQQLPVKLLPDTSSASLKIETLWRSASPYEIEANILEKQEDVLRDIPGIEEMISTAYQGRGVIQLTFADALDKTELLVKVLSKLNNVKEFPLDATPPQVKSFSSAESLVFLFIRKLGGNTKPIDDYQTLVDLNIRSRLSGIPGVAGVQTFIGAQQEFQIVIDPLRAAYLGISLPDVARALRSHHDITSGTMDVGRKSYLLRLQASDSPEQIAQTVLEWRNGNPVRLNDIGEVRIARGKRGSFAIYNGEPAIGMRLTREAGANVLSTLAQVYNEIDQLNNGVLAQQQLKIEKSFDPSIFINRALTMVTSNIVIGIIMAMLVLFAFFRRWQPTLVVTISVPISIIVSFIVLAVFERTINVITLAGVAFASGMVMDAAIVVLESITRERERGAAISEACIAGTRKVWRALLASTLTTVAIFLPIAFTSDSDAQLFADLALTIAISVAVSLLVAAFIIPVICNRLYRFDSQDKITAEPTSEGVALRALKTMTATRRRCLAWCFTLIACPVIFSASLLPDLDYLPPLRKDSVDTIMRFPSSAHLDLIEQEIVQEMATRLQPYLNGEQQPQLKNYFIAVSPGVMSMGTRVEDQSQVGQLKALIKDEITAGFPDTRAYSSQGSITGRFGGNRSFTIHVQADSLEQLNQGVKEIIPMLKSAIPGAVVRAKPALDANQPELRMHVNADRLSEMGWRYSDLQDVVKMLGDGLYIGEYFNFQERIDKIIKTAKPASPQALMQTPLSNTAGQPVYLGNLAQVEETQAPIRLRRVNRRRAISLTIVPPAQMALGVAVDQVTALVPQMREHLPMDAEILMGQTADKLNRSVENLVFLMCSAILLLFLIMAVMFSSVRDSLMVTLTLPLSTIGGVLMLNVLNLFTVQTLDLLTLIGFVILTGLVVNNAILLVAASRDFEQRGIALKEAVHLAIAQRIRPILISTMTSIFGMLPLLINPGTGAEIYRGLAAVVVGGMSLSLLFTLILIPCLLLLRSPSQSHTSGTEMEVKPYA
ncbi:efflux RND transporter permease subunit [Pseudoalteromonas rubra]|uniref:efflux RND transporter permease subunit n=1 Tax=Pseudoalteromonas rubra TaxID=43658 RepID=UPI000F777E69|nr:efflux RND transporter permease subunit [Pseudoalteromonas rubra]